MTWLIIAILSYFLLAIVALADKYLVAGPISNPRVLTFYIGILNILTLFILPFIGFYIPGVKDAILALLSGFVAGIGLLWLFSSLRTFDSSRVVPAVGGLGPLFMFFLILIFSGFKEVLSVREFVSFALLIFGSVFITLEKDKATSKRSLVFVIATSFLFALSFVLTKYAFEVQPFWNGLAWKSFGVFLIAPFLFFKYPDVREEVGRTFSSFANINSLRSGREVSSVTIVFLLSQLIGILSQVLQNYSLFLAPLYLAPIVYALSGTQYIFLLVLAFLLSVKKPHILKEEFSISLAARKSFAVFLILVGLAILLPAIN